MNLLRRAAARRSNLRPFVSRGRLGNTIGYSVAGSNRRNPGNACDGTSLDCQTQVERGVAHAETSQTNTCPTARNLRIHSAGHLHSWRDNCNHLPRCGETTDTSIRNFHHECLTACAYVGEIPLQRGMAGFGCVRILETRRRAKTCWGIGVVDCQPQLIRRAFISVAAMHRSFCCDAEHISSQHKKPLEEGKTVAPSAAFLQMAVRSASATAVTSPYDPTQLPLGCFTPHSDSQTKRSPAANALPALTIAAAAAIAFPIKRGRNGDASRENENANDSDVAKPGSESAAKDRTAEYDHESTNCLSHGAFATYPWGPVLHGLMLIGSGLEVLQQYFSRLTQQLQGANGGVSAGSLRAENGTKLLWFVLQCHLKIVCSAVNQAVGMARLTKVYSSDRLETKQNMQPVERDHSSEAAGVHEKHADGERNIFAGGWTWATHCAASCQKALVGGVAETAKYSSGARFYPGQPKLLDTNVAYSETEGAPTNCVWLTAWYRAFALFFRTVGSALMRLLYVVPLGITAATAGLWLLGLPYLSACLRKLGVGGHWVPHWEAIAQRELEEVIFTAVTAAASAAGPTYVKFLQWIATRPDLFHESLCSRCARLQTSVRPFSYPRAALLLREQFGNDVTRHLLLDPTPVGCGCIAQVYRAYLLLSNEASEKSKRTFLDHAFVLGGSLSKSAAAEIGSGDKLPPVAVAVKVMRPGVREAMEFDLRMMLLIASILQYLPSFGFVAVKKSVEEFAVAMRRQLDFGLEEKHLKLFRANFGLSTIPLPDDLLPMRNRCRRASRPRQCEAPMEDGKAEQKAEQYHTNILGSLSRKILGMRRQVTFPYPFEALSSSEVIVMTLESGFTLNQLFKIRAEPEELEESPRNQRDLREDRGLAMTKREQGDSPVSFPSLAAKKIIERLSNVGMICLHSFLQMVFLDNFFHGDMHSGNLLCRFAHQNKELIFPVLPATLPSRLLTNVPHFDGPLELVVLDCGLAGSLDQADRVNFVTLLEAIARKRGREAALAMLQRAKRSSCQDKEGFCSEVEQLIDEHHFEEGNSLQMSRVRLTSLMGHMLSVSKKYCVELDPSFVSIVVAMSVLEGVGAQLCPDADVLKAALPYSLMAAKLLNPDSSRKA